MKNCTLVLLKEHKAFNDGFVVLKNKKGITSFQKIFLPLVFLFSFLVSSVNISAQLGVYNFTGNGTCPNQNPAVTSQPANAVFGNFSSVNTTCTATTDQFVYKGWNTNNSIDLTEYHEFTITPNANYVLTLTSLSFTHYVDENGSGPGTGTTTWHLRSSIDNFTTDIVADFTNDGSQTPVVTLSPANFTNVGAVTFRLYITEIKKNTTLWTIDDVTLNGSVVLLPANPANPTSNSPQCSNPGVTLTATGTAPAGETWYWQTSATGTSTANSGSTYIVTTSGTYYIRSQDNTMLVWSSGAGSVTVTVTPDVSIPVFTSGATSTRCQGAGTVTYAATATNSTGITYSLDAASITGGNTINSSTGAVTYAAGWSGTSTITASAAGCNGPTNSTHIVTITPTVGTPVFTSGATSTRCQGSGTVTYAATAANATGITYSLDAASITGGNTINPSTGAVTYAAGWSGTSTITANAAGCNGPITSTHVVTITPTVGTPVFTLGATSTRCQAAGTITYTATATNNTGITYSLDAASITGGNTIIAATGVVTYAAAWTGSSTITATATGCNGPKTATHVVTITPTVGTPVFTLGATSTRCQGAGTVTYTATATNNTGITYSLDAASITGGNTIIAATGAVTYVAGWTTTSTITASATGCNGPKTATHVVTITPAVGTPVFTLGATSTRCQGNGNVNYNATASNSTGLVWSLDAASLAAGITINSSNGLVNYVTGWSGITVITATASGCSGPTVSSHTATNTPTVATPVFTLGATSARCLGAATITYTATATNTTGITYSLDGLSLIGGNTINSSTGAVTYAALWVGATTITASAAGCNGPKTSTHTVTINGTVGTPVFTLGATSTRCQGAGTVTYTATATNNSGITYSLDAASITGGNTIVAATGAVTYVAGWTGSSVITATATGCNGPTTSTHTVTITPTVGTPVFTLGATSIRCQGAGTVTYTATATDNTGITYSLNAASITGGNSINAATGAVTYVAGWSGSSTITATATGCNGPKTATHVVTITPTVGTPVFTLGATSTRCLGAATVTYTATSTNNTGITYSLDAASITGGNTINSSTGAVTYLAGWTGTSIITATATGCNGPKTANHTVTINSAVGTPVFTLGATSTRCQGGGTVTYTATAANNTGITYSLDAASTTGGNTINSLTGAVAYVAGWTGTSAITVSATGCNGPTTAIHTVTITPTVGTPVFTLGSTSTRCQGAGTVAYSATSTNNTGITFSLDAASITGGNTINAATGAVTYVAGWSGTSTITASATGCNGPKTATHVVTITPTVGVPAFVLGLESVRTQGAGTVTYTATATTNTGITYVLDAASLAGGNTINAATGAVTYTAGWNGTSMITTTATGCNGPSTASHIVTINASVVQTPLYLSSPGQILDRVDPVSTGMATTIQTGDLSSIATTSITFTQSPALCNDLIIKAQTISVSAYVSITSGAMPANPAITAILKYGATNIITLSNPIYNSGTKLLTWTAILGADVTIPSGQALSLQFTTAQAGVVFKIEYHSASKPSRISLLPVSTFIDITSFNIYNAPYPGGSIRVSGNTNTAYYARAIVTTPFGYSDITGLTVNINPPGANYTATCVDSTACTRTYEYNWTTNATTGNYFLMATAREGYENIIKNSELLSFNVCTVCAPVAVSDSASGAGGAPVIMDVLANDYDPNNNIKVSTLAIVTQPNNGAGYLSNNKIVYLPNGTYAGRDTMTYRICDSTGLCATGQIIVTINPLLIDPCSEATRTHTYFIPYPEQDVYTALLASSNTTMPSNNIRTVISLTMPYPGMTIVWDEWEDGYEANPLNPLQATTKVWGDGNPYNGIAPGYASDIIPAGGSIVLDNTMPSNPRVQANIFYDGRDKITASGQVAITQICGEPTRMPVQDIKTNVTSTLDFGQSFTIPLGQNYPDQDFAYTALFIRAEQDSTTLNIDKDNNGTFETTATLNQGQSYFVNGGVYAGATVTSTRPVGVELNAGGIDGYSIRNASIFPATWYSNTYYTPVPTSDNAGDNPKDTSVVMFYNSLNRPLTINWNSGAPANGTINLPAKTTVRFPLAYSTTAAYKFVNPTGESFTAIEIVDSYTPGGGGNDGTTYDWSFNLIAESRLTDFATTAWAPGGLDLVAPTGPDVDFNPIWVTPSINTTIYVKYDGKVSGTVGLTSPCGLKYDVSIPLNALNYTKIKDPTDNDQSGIAIYTCNGAKLAAVYGEDPMGASTGIGLPYWDVGTTILPFCKQKLIFANDDYARTMINQPVTIPVLLNDFGFLAVIDPTSVTNLGLLQAHHGSISINANGTIIYTPNPGYVGKDTFDYNVCSTPSPIVCDVATVYVDIAVCPAPFNENVIGGEVFLDKNKDGLNNDGSTGVAGVKVYLYVDGNCNSTVDPNELKDSVTVNATGRYQFITYPEKFVLDDFDGPGGTSTCASGSDGSGAWLTNWVDAGDASSVGYCKNNNAANCDMFKDGSFSYGIRLKNSNVSATRTINLSGASYAFLTFSYRRKTALTAGEDVIVQASKDGSTFGTVFTIAGDGNTDANYVTIYNQDITAYASAATYIRFLTNNNVDNGDSVYIDDVKAQFIRYPLCYITKMDSTTVPSNYHTTTLLQHNFTATSSTTCLSPYDFGIAKNTISISGTLFNDGNGLMDALVNGTAMGTVGGTPVYAYLIDTANTVVFRTTVNAGSGTYSFPAADVLTDYQALLSTTSVNIGDPPPPGSAFAAAWINTGDCYGVNNIAGTGNQPGTSDASIAVKTGVLNVTNVNFGIERLPNSDNYTTIIPNPTVNQFMTLNGGTNPPILSGNDPEDYPGGGVLTNEAVVIDFIPNNAELYYNNILTSNGYAISSFDPSLLKVKFTNATVVSNSVIFRYSYVDDANMKDPSPATYTLLWNNVLPVVGLVAQVNLSGNIATVKWSTASEQNTDHFVLERSLDNINYTAIGHTVDAAGNSTSKKEYQQTDNISSLTQSTVIYYRVKLVDIDGRFKYSNVVVLRLSQKPGVTIWPNPFQSAITISITTEKATTIDITLIDVGGRTIRQSSQSVEKGITRISFDGLGQLPTGVYLVEISDKKAGTTYQKLLKNEK